MFDYYDQNKLITHIKNHYASKVKMSSNLGLWWNVLMLNIIGLVEQKIMKLEGVKAYIYSLISSHLLKFDINHY